MAKRHTIYVKPGKAPSAADLDLLTKAISQLTSDAGGNAPKVISAGTRVTIKDDQDQDIEITIKNTLLGRSNGRYVVLDLEGFGTTRERRNPTFKGSGTYSRVYAPLGTLFTQGRNPRFAQPKPYLSCSINEDGTVTWQVERKGEVVKIPFGQKFDVKEERRLFEQFGMTAEAVGDIGGGAGGGAAAAAAAGDAEAATTPDDGDDSQITRGLVLENRGVDLWELLNNPGKLSPPLPQLNTQQKLLIALQVLQIIKKLEEQKMVHRDIKTENFVVDMTNPQKPIVSLIDLSTIAEVTTDAEGLQHVAIPPGEEKTFLGTAECMAPETLKTGLLVSGHEGVTKDPTGTDVADGFYFHKSKLSEICGPTPETKQSFYDSQLYGDRYAAAGVIAEIFGDGWCYDKRLKGDQIYPREGYNFRMLRAELNLLYRAGLGDITREQGDVIFLIAQGLGDVDPTRRISMDQALGLFLQTFPDLEQAHLRERSATALKIAGIEPEGVEWGDTEDQDDRKQRFANFFDAQVIKLLSQSPGSRRQYRRVREGDTIVVLEPDEHGVRKVVVKIEDRNDPTITGALILNWGAADSEPELVLDALDPNMCRDFEAMLPAVTTFKELITAINNSRRIVSLERATITPDIAIQILRHLYQITDDADLQNALIDAVLGEKDLRYRQFAFTTKQKAALQAIATRKESVLQALQQHKTLNRLIELRQHILNEREIHRLLAVPKVAVFQVSEPITSTEKANIGTELNRVVRALYVNPGIRTAKHQVTVQNFVQDGNIITIIAILESRDQDGNIISGKLTFTCELVSNEAHENIGIKAPKIVLDTYSEQMDDDFTQLLQTTELPEDSATQTFASQEIDQFFPQLMQESHGQRSDITRFYPRIDFGDPTQTLHIVGNKPEQLAEQIVGVINVYKRSWDQTKKTTVAEAIVDFFASGTSSNIVEQELASFNMEQQAIGESADDISLSSEDISQISIQEDPEGEISIEIKIITKIIKNNRETESKQLLAVYETTFRAELLPDSFTDFKMTKHKLTSRSESNYPSQYGYMVHKRIRERKEAFWANPNLRSVISWNEDQKQQETIDYLPWNWRDSILREITTDTSRINADDAITILRHCGEGDEDKPIIDAIFQAINDAKLKLTHQQQEELGEIAEGNSYIEQFIKDLPQPQQERSPKSVGVSGVATLAPPTPPTSQQTWQTSSPNLQTMFQSIQQGGLSCHIEKRQIDSVEREVLVFAEEKPTETDAMTATPPKPQTSAPFLYVNDAKMMVAESPAVESSIKLLAQGLKLAGAIRFTVSQSAWDSLGADTQRAIQQSFNEKQIEVEPIDDTKYQLLLRGDTSVLAETQAFQVGASAQV